MSRRKLGVLLALPPTHDSADTVYRLSEAALRHQDEVYLYLIDEGVKNIHDARFSGLAQQGVKLFACAYGCQQHHVSTAGIHDKISLCGLVVLSGLIDACDRFLSFT